VTARRSSGILLFRRGEAGLELLLAHPGGPYFLRKDAGSWTIPKGQPDGEDDLWAVAAREFGEETGHALEACRRDATEAIELGSVTLGSGKVVHGWAVEGELDPATLASNEFEIEWPPRSGRRQVYPEVDRAAWFSPDEARVRMHPAQAAFVDRLVEALERA
jgi:predicted NUDIX family NTP pyrophosphohydrolase